jgi:hypothetical protein
MKTPTTLEVIYLRTKSLKPDPRNPRVHSDKQVRQIAQSIESFGFNVPILIDDQQQVIAGHGRLQAAQKLGWDTVPAIRLSHLTESQRTAFLIADNRLSENSSWDDRLLGEQLKSAAGRGEIVIVPVTIALGANDDATAIARMVSVLETDKGEAYCCEAVVGVLPSVV